MIDILQLMVVDIRHIQGLHYRYSKYTSIAAIRGLLLYLMCTWKLNCVIDIQKLTLVDIRHIQGLHYGYSKYTSIAATAVV